MNKPVTLRLDRWLASQGQQSRKEVKQLIRKGLVQVNGEIVKSPDHKVLESDSVSVNGKPFTLSRYVYYMMNKPQGVLSATRDKHAQTVLDLLPEEMQRPELFPAGRLDKDTEGFLLITNDGDFAHQILAPKNHIPKTYEVHLDKPFIAENLAEAFQEGVVIGKDAETSGAELKVLEMGSEPIVELTIYEGMFHQVKRMFAAFDLEVVFLKRIKMGQLFLDENLALGETREIDEMEKNLLLMR